jgi:predicted alpha/beta-fold hydrolase
MSQPEQLSHAERLRRLAAVPHASPPAAEDASPTPPQPVPLRHSPGFGARVAPLAGHASRHAQAIAPHARRHATRARRKWWAVLFFPVFVLYVGLDLVRGVRDRVAREREAIVKRRPSFRRPEAMGAVEDRSMADIVSVLERFPFRPANISTNHAFFRDNGADALGALLSPNPQVTTFPHFYPPYFEQCLVTGDDDVQLAAMRAIHDRKAPAVIICHGLLMTKHFEVIIALARRAFEEWGFHVVTLDMRGWGQSAWTTDAPPSAGYHEGRDIVEVARALHQDERVTSVAGIGFSLGGASMLNAAHVTSLSEDRPLDGGVVCVSAPTEVDEAIRFVSTKPTDWRDPFFGLWHLFGAVIRSSVRRRRMSPDVKTWYDLVFEQALPYYGIDYDEFVTRASAERFAHEIDIPVLELHAADDFVVPVHHAYRLQDRTADNPWVHVIVKDSGNHCSFPAVDSSWYHSTLRRWLEYWATPAVGTEPEDAPLD